ncbi:MAG: hypothetical protein JOY53_03950 [Acidobacteriaceae bacterium]|nr:hypothetical protein [Acidobacteriaceae bacterium]
MTSLDNHRTHYCPDSGFSLISENDLEFEQCNCFTTRAQGAAANWSGEPEPGGADRRSLAAQEKWYRTLAALARVCGIGKAVRPEPAFHPSDLEETAELKNDSDLVKVRKA